eukprot:1632081-Pleurochrysis_carterae.AAC.2
MRRAVHFRLHRRVVKRASGRRARNIENCGVIRVRGTSLVPGAHESFKRVFLQSERHASWRGGRGCGVGATCCVGNVGESGGSSCDASCSGSGAPGCVAGRGRGGGDPGAPSSFGFGRVEGIAKRVSWIVIQFAAARVILVTRVARRGIEQRFDHGII